MKKTLHAVIALTFLLISTGTMAQFDKGGKFVETNLGNIGFSKNNNRSESGGTPSGKSDYNSFSFNLYPRVGFFIADNLAVGGEVDIYFGTGKGNNFNSSGIKTSESKSSSASLGVGPFVRYYFGGDKRSRFYAQAGGSVSADVGYKSESKSYSGSGVYLGMYKTEYTKKPITVGANAMVGWNRLLTETVALNLNLGYRFSTYTYTYQNRSIPAAGPETLSPEYKYKSDTHGVSWNIGFTMFLPSGGKHTAKKK